MTTSNLSVGQITGSATNSGVINLPTANKIVGADSGSIRTPGMILQVLQGSLAGAGASLSTTSLSFVTTGVSVTITPFYNSSKILVMCQVTQVGGNTGDGGSFAYYRNGTQIFQPGFAPAGSQSYMVYSGTSTWQPTVSMQYLDAPASTSSQTYTVYFRSYAGAAFYIGGAGGASANNAIHTITVMEVAA